MGGQTFIIYTNGINVNIDFINAFMSLKHRGPDDSNYITLSTDNLNDLNQHQMQTVHLRLTKDELRKYVQYNFIMGYHRLSINDLSYNGSQPFEDPIMYKLMEHPELRDRPPRQLICNGEIYNYNALKEEYKFGDKDLSSNSDVEIIMPLYIENNNIEECLLNLDGEFAFILTENIKTFELKKVNVFACRDYLGMKPLYYVKNQNSSLLMFVSEMKSLPSYIINNASYSIQHVPPGTYWSFNQSIMNNMDTFTPYYSLDKFKSLDSCVISSTHPDVLVDIYENLQKLVVDSVISRYKLSDRKTGILLSGGFDSCLMTSIIVKHLVDSNHDFTNEPFHVFTVGDELGSDDIDCNHAVDFVKFLEDKFSIDIHHHIININTINLLARDIDDIIYHLESYEPETVRESIPFYYLMKYISEKTDVKVLLSGDGIEELFGGYEEFNDFSDEHYQLKSVELLQYMHKFDLLRLDRISNMFSLEVRHPFLKKELVEYILSIHPKLKRPAFYAQDKPPISKYLLRKAFDVAVYNEELIDHAHIWKEHNCLCNSLTNFELRLKYYMENDLMTEEEFNQHLDILLNESGINKNTLPRTIEEMYYRLSFRKKYPNRDYIVDIYWDELCK